MIFIPPILYLIGGKMKVVIRLPVVFTVVFLFSVSCFGPFDPFNPPPDKPTEGTISEDSTPASRFPSGMIAFWSCDDTGGSSLYDSLGKNHGQITGCGRREGISGLALQFNGGGDYVSVPSSGNHALNFGRADFTISLWVRPNIVTLITDTTQFNILSKGIAREKGYTVSITRNNFSAFVGQYKAASIDTLFPANADVWRHLVLIRRKSNVEFYVDNTKIQTYTVDVDVSSDLPLLFGRDASGRQDRFYSGLIDEVKIFNIAWSASDIAGEYRRLRD